MPIGGASAVEGLRSTGLPGLVFEDSALWAESFYKSICPSVCLFVCLCVCPFLSVLFKRPFAPTSQNPMSKTFRDSESLEKSNGKMGFKI